MNLICFVVIWQSKSKENAMVLHLNEENSKLNLHAIWIKHESTGFLNGQRNRTVMFVNGFYGNTNKKKRIHVTHRSMEIIYFPIPYFMVEEAVRRVCGIVNDFQCQKQLCSVMLDAIHGNIEQISFVIACVNTSFAEAISWFIPFAGSDKILTCDEFVLFRHGNRIDLSSFFDGELSVRWKWKLGSIASQIIIHFLKNILTPVCSDCPF